MKKDEILLEILAAVMIIGVVVFCFTRSNARMAACDAECVRISWQIAQGTDEPEYFTVQDEECPEMAFFDVTEHELPVLTGSFCTLEFSEEEILPEIQPFTEETEVAAVANEAEPAEPAKKIPIYSIDGLHLPADLQIFLYEQLDRLGISWWYEFALCQAFQESGFRTTVVSKDGLDKGLFQFREQYWSANAALAGFAGADIFDPYAQIIVYCHRVANDLNRGCSVDETISNHYSGGMYYAAEYVAHVRQHINHLRSN